MLDLTPNPDAAWALTSSFALQTLKRFTGKSGALPGSVSTLHGSSDCSSDCSQHC